jgi:hypothetical protein
VRGGLPFWGKGARDEGPTAIASTINGGEDSDRPTRAEVWPASRAMMTSARSTFQLVRAADGGRAGIGGIGFGLSPVAFPATSRPRAGIEPATLGLRVRAEKARPAVND